MAITHFKDQKKLIILCDSCFQDITYVSRIQCIICTSDICISCFFENKKVKNHTIMHSYKVIEPLTFPIYNKNWTALEELLFIEGIFAFGLGNWKDISEFLGTKSEKELELHFYEISKMQNDFSQERVEVSHSNHSNPNMEDLGDVNKGSLGLLPSVSNPNFHDISSFMPFRKDFDTEIENDYENLLKEINNDTLFENENMQELKEVLFESYLNVLKIRNQRKYVILEKKLYDYKNEEYNEIESEVIKKMKCLSSFLNKNDFNNFYKGLCIEKFLYNFRIKKSVVKEDYLTCEKKRFPLLSDLERRICVSLKMSYKEYLKIKNKIVEEKIKYGFMDYKKMRSVLGYNNKKSECLYKFFKANKWI